MNLFQPYPDLKFYVNIRRRTLYYGFNLIIPSLLISLMTVLGFTLPPDAGEKITLEITILLSVCFFLSIVADMSPPTSEAVPLIGTFFSCCMLVVSASVVFTVVVLNLHYRTPDTHEMSPFVRSVLLNWLPWLLMMRRPGHTFLRTSIIQALAGAQPQESQAAPRQCSVVRESESLMRNVRSQEDVPRLVRFAKTESETSSNAASETKTDDDNSLLAKVQQAMERSTALARQIATHRRESIALEAKLNTCLKPLLDRPGTVDTGVHALILMLQRVHMELKFITKRMEKEDEDEDDRNDWKFAAMVVDRLCLVVFSLFIIASTCGIMFSAPNLQL